MRSHLSLIRIILIFVACLPHLLSGEERKSHVNVLFIAVDDLRPELGCYGAKHVFSPNIDRLASEGLVFKRAYCQQSVCNPSRTSLMTGMRPDSIGVTGNHTHFRDKKPGAVTLPQYFKHQGYHAAGIGKIYHGVFPDGASIQKWDTMGDPQSWSVPAIRFGPRYYYTEEGISEAKRIFHKIYKPKNSAPDDWTKKLVFGPATESPVVGDSILYDGKVADAAVKALRELKKSETPFFLAVGFIKPHSPFIAPKKYFDLYDVTELPGSPAFPLEAPSFAGHGSGELRRYTDQPKSGDIPEANQLRVRQAYFACISYIDAQVGRVLDELDHLGLGGNTIVVLYGDHGYHLGEQGLWGKTTNFELDTRVPLVVRAPGMKAPGQSSSSLVELVDLYPTLAELAGLPIVKQLEGKSFAQILNDPGHSTKKAALSQFPRSGGLMGYSMRTGTHRLTQWVHSATGEIRATELYDYSGGLIEKENLAGKSPELIKKLTTQLFAAFADSFVTSPQPQVVNGVHGVSFEKVRPGPFDQLKTSAGTWKSEIGKVLIDDKHSKTGKCCLQLSGDENSTVTLRIAGKLQEPSELTFWAERWTSRAPFSFRISADSGNGWEEIYDGDKKIRVGRAFLNHVKVVLPSGIERLQFSCASPPNTGILIDDLRIAPTRPQKITNIEVIPFSLPALVGNDASALLKLKIEVSGQLNPVSLTELHTSLSEVTNYSDLLSVEVRYGAGSDRFPASKSVASKDPRKVPGKPLVFSMPEDACVLTDGTNYVWLACRLDARANIDRLIEVFCQQAVFSNGRKVRIDSSPSVQRMGVAVRNGGDDKVNTYRIPGLVTTNKGTLIGVYDVRWRGGGDLPGDIDVGMSRSTDGGRTWEPMKIIMDMGNDPNWKYDGIGDPAILVDQTTGTIWVAATWSHGNRSWRGSGPGLKPEETGQLMLVRSDDDGVTWSEPINITEQVKKPEWCFILQGPGKGITMRDGTIVFAAQYQDTPERKRLPRSTIIYSRDHGMTWKVGTGAFDDTTEAQVVETEPGTLMLNCRYNRKAVRVVMTTNDMGKTWRKHATSERSLIEPRSCMASLIDVDQEVGKDVGNWLLFSNPDSTRGRHHITIKASPDLGQTWPKEHRLLLDEETSAGYSCMSMIDERTVGILYEGSQAHMTFQRIPLKDLIDKKLVNNEIPLEADQGKLRLPRVFGDHMVLQADRPIPVWGDSRAGASVTVVLGAEKKKVRADERGKWSVRMDSRHASRKPIELVISSGSERIVFKDALIGEVWVCAGQSNMEWMLAQSANAGEELASAENPNLRLLHLAGGARGSLGTYTPQHLTRLNPGMFCEGQWETASGASAGSFSAVAWYFGRHLQQELKVPVGLICPAVGGTPTEAWIPSEAMESNPVLKGLVQGNWLDNERLGQFCRMRGQQNLLAAIQSGLTIPGDQFGPNHSFKPGFMWKAGIEPLIPYAFRGVIWYQGESNAETRSRVREHGKLFPLLIKQWRQQWGQGDFPFLFVQLPALNRSEWPLFREGQRRILDQLENIGMAVTIDTGHPTDVHPREKKPVGERLAKWALGTTYLLKKHATYSGPFLDVAEREGDSLVVSFNQVGGGLETSDKKAPRHFEVCGEDGVFHPAGAKIIGKNTLSVASPKVSVPQHVRYAWTPYPVPSVNLINSEDLPASPFSSESEETIFASGDEQPIKKISKNTRPNILLIVGEDHGCELSCYGDPVINTPNIDALASDGVLFENGYVTQSVCSSSRSTIFTGLYPHQNGQLGLATHQYGWFKKWPTTYSLLKKAGYRTGLIGKTHVIPTEAVEDFVDFRFQKSSNFAKRKVAEYAVKAGEFFRTGDEPFFMTVNYPDAHWPLQGRVDGLPGKRVNPKRVKVMPYVGGSNPRLREIARNYYDCMLRLDACVGQLLNQLKDSGKAENTLVVFIGDHGAQMARGKVTVYEGGLRVPYIVRWPGSTKPNHRSKALVSTIDLLPTFMDAAGVPVPKGLPGKSLLSVLKGDDTTGESFRKYLACERNCDAARHTFPQRTIRDARYKLIHSPVRDREDPAARYYRNHGASHWTGCLTDKELTGASEQTKVGYARWLKPPEFQLYDLTADPHEWTDLSNDTKHAEAKRRLQTALKEWQTDTRDPISDREKLSMLMKENEAVFKVGRRWPREGWQYLKYMAPGTGGRKPEPSPLK